MNELNTILGNFAIEGEISEIKPLGNGLINDTYKVTTAGNAPDYVLQRINNAIFQDVDMLQNNIEAVTSTSARNLSRQGKMTLTVKC